MESRPDSTTIDPYAPPKAKPIDTNATYLDQDGYAFNDELVTNKYFKPPLICAKLGISLENEENPQSIPVSVMRKSRLNPYLENFISLVAFILILLLSFYANREYQTLIMFSAFIFIPLLKRLMSKPYQIYFYFSNEYKDTRKRFIAIYLLILTILTIGFIYGTQLGSIEGYNAVAAPCALGFLIILIMFLLKLKHFTHNKSKGDFLYLHGAHPDFLKALPQLPLATKSATQDKP